MSILIKGLQMQEGQVYNISLISRGRAIVHNDDGTASYYDAIEIPAHGRLIDADKFKFDECGVCDGCCEAFNGNECSMCHKECRCEFMKDIDEAPTIIESEE